MASSAGKTLFVTGAATELGREFIRQAVAAGQRVAGLVHREKDVERVRALGGRPLLVREVNAANMARLLEQTEPEVIVNLAGQRANTLLHDGHDWGELKPLPHLTHDLLQGIRMSKVDVQLLIQGSFAFLYGNGPTADEGSPLRPPRGDAFFKAAVKAEQLIADNEVVPFTILRFGYFYGPQSHDLKLYELSFKMQRPYYAGPENHRANFVHFEDAARALVLTAEKQPAGRIINIVDGTAASFGDLIDEYANQLGRRQPSRIPSLLVGALPLLITPQQVKMLELTADKLGYEKAEKLLGWTPQYSDYRAGLAQTLRSWGKEES
ncbi:MAG: NAD(P)-dependent oxidoreductase [Anaerolineales bacterium]|nr:NAD(P)-dependent oxidoreductase [Anaerolineales bacterium]